jgi:hypothetical protein
VAAAARLNLIHYPDKKMTLHEIIQSIESHPEGATIFAERINGAFRPESRAVLIEMTDEELSMPVQEVAASRTPGADYFLEIFVAREVLEGWREYRQGTEITPNELTEVMIYYAENDAWPMKDDG